MTSCRRSGYLVGTSGGKVTGDPDGATGKVSGLQRL
jgi:hypothetical protein